MKVYIVSFCEAEEGCNIEAVFDSREKAEACLKEKGQPYWSCCSRVIEEFNVE